MRRTLSRSLRPIHPFPARMAPEIVAGALEGMPPSAIVLDPMCGSGTVVRTAMEGGLHVAGRDLDPLAVLMTEAWTTALDVVRLQRDAQELVGRARALDPRRIASGSDRASRDFVSYWFAKPQAESLARLSTVLRGWSEPNRRALSVALSRIIVSKEMQASLARDTSHSRPHRVARWNDFDVYQGFLRAVGVVASRIHAERLIGRADVRQEDARDLESVEDRSINAVVTSPPYLNAIDYLRGHRLALVWLGYTVGQVRDLRSRSIGAERMADHEAPVDVERFVSEAGGARLDGRCWGWILRYAVDMGAVLAEIRRVLTADGRAVLIVGNSFLRGARVDNAGIVESLAVELGFSRVRREVRQIPARRRYLPPPSSRGGPLDTRMREEVVLHFAA